MSVEAVAALVCYGGARRLAQAYRERFGCPPRGEPADEPQS